MFLRLFSTVFKRPCDCEIFVREPTFEALDCSDHVTVRHGLLGPDRVPRVLHDDGGQDDTSGRRGADQVSSLLPTLGWWQLLCQDGVQGPGQEGSRLHTVIVIQAFDDQHRCVIPACHTFITICNFYIINNPHNTFRLQQHISRYKHSIHITRI